MRKVLIVGLLLFVGLAAAMVVAFRNLDVYLTENRELVSAQVADVLGRDVHFESVAVSWSGGFGVRVEALRIGDDPAFSDEDFLSADAVDVRVGLLPALFGRVEVGRVILRAPRVFVTQTPSGLSTDSLGGGAPAAESETGGAPPALGIALLNLRDGALRFVDRTVEPAVTLEIEQLDVRASELGVVEPVDFDLSAALFGAPDQNLTVSGTLGPLASDAPQLDVDLALDLAALEQVLRVPFLRALLPEDLAASGRLSVDVEAGGTLADLTFAARVDASGAALSLGESIDKPAGTRLEVALEGTKRGDRVAIPSLHVTLDDTRVSGSADVVLGEPTRVVCDLGSDAVELAAFGAGEAGDVVRKLSVKAEVTLPESGPHGSIVLRSPDGRVRGADYTSFAVDVKLRGQRYEIESLTANAFDGTLRGSGRVELRPDAAPRFDFDTQLSGMRIESLLEMVAGRAARLLNGNIDARVDLNGSGNGWEQIRQVITGAGELRLSDGVLKDFNPAGDTLRALMVIPGVGGSGIGRVLEAHPELLGRGDTRIDDLVSHFEIRQGWLQVRELVVRTTQYVLNGAGRYSLAGELDFKMALVFGEQLSQELLAAEPGLRYIRNRDGRVALPVALRGAPPKVAVVPDVSKLAGNVAREALMDVLGDALGVEPARPEGAGAPAPAQPGGLLGGILGEALGQEPAPQPPAAEPEREPEPAPTPERAPTPEEVGSELLRQGLEGLLGGQRN
ncbi:MAG: DUF748 domain-containing protein [Deltaproteobacteria bacterium]|nr:DUF748 domain-containing protein [Deltaproteobacteria bacterium]